MTAFPGVYVKSLEVQRPPFDEPGVIQEFVGEGVITEFERLKLADEFTEETVGEVLESAQEMIGVRDRFRLKYNLVVRAPTSGPFSKRGAKALGRSFVRAKNPFEVDLLSVMEPTINNSLSDEKVGTVYDVTAMVDKR